MAEQEYRPGGAGPIQPATPDVQEIVNKVRPQLEEQAGCTYTEFTAVQFRTQVVAGTNFFVKVAVGCEKYVHLRIFRDLTGNVSLAAFQPDKTLEDPLEYF